VLEIDENTVENADENIGEIGRKIQLKLRETVFKQSFRDLKRSDYMKTRSETVNLICLESNEMFETEFNRLCNIEIDVEPIRVDELSPSETLSSCHQTSDSLNRVAAKAKMKHPNEALETRVKVKTIGIDDDENLVDKKIDDVHSNAYEASESIPGLIDVSSNDESIEKGSFAGEQSHLQDCFVISPKWPSINPIIEGNTLVKSCSDYQIKRPDLDIDIKRPNIFDVHDDSANSKTPNTPSIKDQTKSGDLGAIPKIKLVSKSPKKNVKNQTKKSENQLVYPEKPLENEVNIIRARSKYPSTIPLSPNLVLRQPKIDVYTEKKNDSKLQDIEVNNIGDNIGSHTIMPLCPKLVLRQPKIDPNVVKKTGRKANIKFHLTGEICFKFNGYWKYC